MREPQTRVWGDFHFVADGRIRKVLEYFRSYFTIGHMKHFMRLAPVPYTLIRSGWKVIESRLFDEKRSQIQIGDSIVFSRSDSPEDMTEV